MQVLHCAARAGDPALTKDALAVIEDTPGLIVHEWHLSPVFVAYCESRNFSGAIRMLAQMESMGATPSANIAASLKGAAAESDATLDDAHRALVEARDDRGSFGVTRAALDALLYACAKRKNLARSRALYNELVCSKAEQLALSTSSSHARDGRVVPTISTIHALLDSCLAQQDIEYGMVVWGEAQERGIPPTPSTYEMLVRLCTTQHDYERAFTMLEELKASRRLPTRRTYAALLWTCWRRQDARWQPLLQEMVEAQYKPSKLLSELITSDRASDDVAEEESPALRDLLAHIERLEAPRSLM